MDRGTAAGPVDPHDPVFDSPDLRHHALPRRHGRPGSAPSPRCSSPSATEHVLNQIRGRHRRALPPTSDRIGGLKGHLPKGWVDDTKAVMEKVPHLLRQMEDLIMGNEIFQARTAASGVIPADVALSTASPAPTCALERRRLGPPPRPALRPRLEPGSRLERHGPTPTVTPSPASGCASQEPAKPPGSWTSTASRPGPIAGQGPHIIRCRRAGLRRHQEPLKPDGLLRHLQGDLVPFPGQRSAPPSFQQHLDRALGDEGRLPSPDGHHHPRQPVLHPGDIDR